MIDLTQAAQTLKKQTQVIILTHANPDGDTLGCGYALMRAFKKLGIKAVLLNSDKIPDKFGYMRCENDAVDEKTAFVLAVDVADPKLLGSLEEKFSNRVGLCIDHHGSNLMYAESTFVDSEAAAACETVYKLIKLMGVEIDGDTATCLYTGISTDTGCFRYSNVTAETHIAAAELISLGARHSFVNTLMFETKSKAYFALEKLCLDGMKLCFDDKVAIIKLTGEMYKKSGADESYADAISSIPRQVEGVKIGVTIKEKAQGEYKISLRTHEPYDAAAICKTLGGGGHARAAGCQISGSLEQAESEIIKAIEKVII